MSAPNPSTPQEVGGRRLLMSAQSFSDVLTYHGEWDGADNGPEPTIIDGNEVGPYCTIDLSSIGGPRHRSIYATLTPDAVAALQGALVTPDDRLTFKIVSHKGTGRALVVVEHGYIIGSRYLAYIRPDSIPVVDSVPELDS